MASTGGGSSSSAASTEMDERRLKRRLSNRESARRTRARKQQQMNELEAEAEALRGKKSGLEEAARGCSAVEAENVVLRARALELGARLHSLADLLRCMDTSSSSVPSSGCSSVTLPMPITASPDMYTYYYYYYY